MPSIPPIQSNPLRRAMRGGWLRGACTAFALTSLISAALADYLVDFEGAEETKGAYASGTVTLSGLDWDMTEVNIGTLAADWKNGLRSARLRGYGTSSMSMLEDKTAGAGTISFSYRRYGSDTQVPWLVEYSTDGGMDWTQVGSTFAAPASDDVQTFSEVLDIAGSIRFRIKQDGTSASVNRRLNIDDILITDYLGDDVTPPTVVTLSPNNGANGVLANTTISITFDEPVKTGNGNVILRQDQTAVETFPASSGNFDGATVTFTPSAPLEFSESYFVIVESTAFEDLADNPFPGLLNPTDWAFVTAPLDDTPPSPTLFPLEDSSDFVATASPTLTYDEPVVLGSGVIEIFDAASVLVESFDVGTSLRVTLIDDVLRIDLTDPLDLDSSYHIVVPAGAVEDLSGNPSVAIAGPDGWNFTTRGIPAVVISQYYEGASQDRYLELHNTTGDPLSLDGFQIVAFSPSNDAGNQGWKIGESSPRLTDLSGETIPANGYFLIAEPAANAPAYAIPDLSPAFPSAVAFAGTASIVLYQSASFDISEVIDAVSVSTNEGIDVSYYRVNNLPGFDFNIGSSILDYTGSGQPWASKTVAEVDAAGLSDPWLLRGTTEVVALTITLDSTTVVKDSVVPVTATVTRSSGVGELIVFVEADVPSGITFVADDFIVFDDGVISADVEMLPVDTPFSTGDRIITITATADVGVIDGTAQLTIKDKVGDVVIPIVINEIDSDTPGTDLEEFIELYNNSSEEVSLDDVVVVFYNGGIGAGEASYAAFDLSGFTIAGNGFFVLGNEAIASRQVTFNNNLLQNGPDAVALYYGVRGSDFPNGTPASSAPGFLVDAVVYGRTGDADATVLLAALTPEGFQLIEGSTASAPLSSLARVPDGGDRFDSLRWVAQAPTPGFTNVIPEPPADYFATWIAGFDIGGFDGPNDNPSGDGIPNLLKHILGLAPDVVNIGPVVEVSAAGAGTITFVHNLAKEIAGDIEYGYEWSTDLATWTADGGSVGGVTVAFSLPTIINGTDAGYDVVAVDATVTAGAAPKLFVRLTGNLLEVVE